MIVTIAGAIIAIILAILAVGALVAILEVFKFIAVGLAILLSYFYFNKLLKRRFDINENVSIVVSLLFSVMLGILVYTKWWAIITLLIILGIAYAVYQYYFGDLFEGIEKYLGGVK